MFFGRQQLIREQKNITRNFKKLGGGCDVGSEVIPGKSNHIVVHFIQIIISKQWM